MAKLASNSAIQFRGKLSNIVASEWNGIIIIKAAPRWKKKYKATPKQKANQQKFKYANRIIGIFKQMLDMTVEKETGQTRASQIMRQILREAMIGDWPSTTIDYSKMLMAKGSLPPADSPTAKAVQGGKIEFEWEYDQKNYPKYKNYETNGAMLIAFGEDLDEGLCYDVNGPSRYQKKAVLQGKYKKGEKVHTWISFRSGDFGLKANSVYTGLVTIK